jgi:hypothetical protein
MSPSLWALQASTQPDLTRAVLESTRIPDEVDVPPGPASRAASPVSSLTAVARSFGVAVGQIQLPSPKGD